LFIYLVNVGIVQDSLMRLKPKEFIISNIVREWLRLVDVLYAYAYDVRTTDGEHTCESAWTICSIASTLSWLDSFTNIAELQASLYHRALAYPLHRHFDLCERVWQDVTVILNSGKVCVVKCLVEVKRILDTSDSRYLLNTVVVDDLLVWFQQSFDAHRESLSIEMAKVHTTKSDIRWGLIDLENKWQDDSPEAGEDEDDGEDSDDDDDDGDDSIEDDSDTSNSEGEDDVSETKARQEGESKRPLIVEMN
jgi:protein SHQ1